MKKKNVFPNFISDPRNQKAKNLERTITLQAIAILGLLPDNIKNRINKLGALSVMPLRPVVPCPGLPEDEVIGPEYLPERPGSNGIHGPRFQIHEHGARNVPPATRLIVIHVDALELELRVAAVLARVVDPVLVTYHLPELRPDLVAALAPLDVQDFSHFKFSRETNRHGRREKRGGKN